MNPYTVLGVDRSASKEEVKKAYRRLAGKHHPDRGGDPEQFRQIQEAYEQITNPQPEPQFHAGGSPFGFGDDIFSQFGDIFGRQRQQRNPDVMADARISLMQAHDGTDLLLDIEGKREVIQIQPGTRDKTKIRLHGKGYQRFPNLPPGDLIVRINVIYPHNVQQHMDDIYSQINVSAIDAMIGSDIEVDHFTGKRIKLKVPPGSQNGAKLRIPGWGMPNPQTRVKGNFYAIINVIVPEVTKQEHRDILNNIKREINT